MVVHIKLVANRDMDAVMPSQNRRFLDNARLFNPLGLGEGAIYGVEHTKEQNKRYGDSKNRDKPRFEFVRENCFSLVWITERITGSREVTTRRLVY